MKVLAEGDFRAAVRSEVRRCKRYSHWFAVVSVDLLPPSDETEAFIRMAAEVVGSDVRETDVVGRLKGSRLGVILHHAEFGDAYLIAERIRERLASDPKLTSRPAGFEPGAFQTVVFPEMATDADTLFRRLGVLGEGESGDDEGPEPVGDVLQN